MVKAFISYKRNADPDERLADYFAQYLTQQGHQIFIDKQTIVGQKWPTIIEQNIKEADFLIVLLSKYSVVSDMVAQEVSIAHRLNKIILPVRVAYYAQYFKRHL